MELQIKPKENKAYEKLCQQLALLLSQEETYWKNTDNRAWASEGGDRQNVINVYCV